MRPSPPNVPDGGALGKLVVFPEDGGCLPGGPDTSAKREKWQMVVNEIVETERSYVEALSGVITVRVIHSPQNFEPQVCECYELHSLLLCVLDRRMCSVVLTKTYFLRPVKLRAFFNQQASKRKSSGAMLYLPKPN